MLKEVLELDLDQPPISMDDLIVKVLEKFADFL
jgi:hypothetical protein